MSIHLFVDRWLSSVKQSQFEWFLTITALMTLTWIVLAIFIYWRQAKTNLTPVDVPSANTNAVPDFLQVDHKKRNEALQRGDQYADELETPEKQAGKSFRKARLAMNISGWIAFVLATFLLAIVITGSLYPQSYVGNWLNQYSEDNRLMEILTHNPITILAAVFIVAVKSFVSIFLKIGIVR